MEPDKKFEVYAIVELFGHNKMAGKVSEQTIGGATMIRIDVPNTEAQPAFTRFMHINAIYAINPVTEEIATATAGRLNTKPIDVWDAREILRRADEQKKLAAANPAYDAEYEDRQREAENDLNEEGEEEEEEIE